MIEKDSWPSSLGCKVNLTPHPPHKRGSDPVVSKMGWKRKARQSKQGLSGMENVAPANRARWKDGEEMVAEFLWMQKRPVRPSWDLETKEGVPITRCPALHERNPVSKMKRKDRVSREFLDCKSSRPSHPEI